MAVVQSINVAGAISSLPNEYISGAANWFSYRAMDLYFWTGTAGIMDSFRKKLGLPSYPKLSAEPAHAVAGLQLPVTYLWSPVLQEKPADWGAHIAVQLSFRRDFHSCAHMQPDPVLRGTISSGLRFFSEVSRV